MGTLKIPEGNSALGHYITNQDFRQEIQGLVNEVTYAYIGRLHFSRTTMSMAEDVALAVADRMGGSYRESPRSDSDLETAKSVVRSTLHEAEHGCAGSGSILLEMAAGPRAIEALRAIQHQHAADTPTGKLIRGVIAQAEG